MKGSRRTTRRQFSTEEKIRIVLGGLRGEDTITELCRGGSLGQSPHYVWSKEFLEADNPRLAGDTACTATTDEVMNLRCECSRCWRWVSIPINSEPPISRALRSMRWLAQSREYALR